MVPTLATPMGTTLATPIYPYGINSNYKPRGINVGDLVMDVVVLQCGILSIFRFFAFSVFFFFLDISIFRFFVLLHHYIIFWHIVTITSSFRHIVTSSHRNIVTSSLPHMPQRHFTSSHRHIASSHLHISTSPFPCICRNLTTL